MQHSLVTSCDFFETSVPWQPGWQAGTSLAMRTAMLHVPRVPSREEGVRVLHPVGHSPLALAKKMGLVKTPFSH